MNDIFSRTKRSVIMSAIHSTNTQPELKLRRVLHRLGYRYRLHGAELPGTPDLVFPSRSKVVFVHGCYWHRHSCKRGRSLPSTNRNFWERKFARNVARDRKNRRAIKRLGWNYLTVWECQIRHVERYIDRIVGFLES